MAERPGWALPREHDLGDIEWGDVVSDSGGVLVCEATLDDQAVVVKRYRDSDQVREVSNYELLRRLGVPTLRVLAAGDDWLALEDVTDSFDWRLATQEDLRDPEVLRLLAAWYDQLHAAGAGIAELDEMFDEVELVTPETLALLAARRPELAAGLAALPPQVERWLELDAQLPRTLVFNDFSWTNLVVGNWRPAAMPFDLGMLGRGPRYRDLRNVTSQLEAPAAEVFTAAYVELAAARGVVLDPLEAEVDEPLAHLVALVSSLGFEQLPVWAEPSAEWVRARAT